ncbi:bardet-Biedl syndrome 2 protein [Thraustotheca clavata]|uniref:Bardet-Biedl syndrome 2 protein n=1 Tax=Thraustotheca clavata TaxID=74557 RepID=A0A1V9Z6S6_9STRA|nr:bardet-Biedl syndrome 2 protein [Thraustotheca clavata]
MLPTFKLHMHQPILERLARVGKFDGTHPSLTCATSSGKVFIHNPNEHNDEESTPCVRFLNINRQVSALCVGKFKEQDVGDTLIVGTQANILGYNVEKNSDTFYKDVPDGVNTLHFGSLPTIPSKMVLVGGNCSIQGFDRDGNELFWTVTGDNVTAMTICDVSGSGRDELVVGSDDYEIRAFQQEDVVCECHESGRIVDLTAIDKQLFGYALDNGTVGVYKGKNRAWRVKSKNIPTSIAAFDINGDGDKEIVIGWNNGKFEARNLSNGEVVFRDTFTAPISSILTADYRMRGQDEVVCCAQDGEIRGYMFEGGIGTNVVSAAELMADQISAEEKEVQDLIKMKAGLTNELKAFENAMAKVTKSGNTRLAPASRIVIKATASVANSCVELTVSTESENIIKMVTVFDYDAGILEGESMVTRPATPAPTATVQIRAVKKTVQAKLHFKVLVGNRGTANVYHVFEDQYVLPKFAVFSMLKAPLKERPAGVVKFKTPGKMQQQFASWVKATFLVSDLLEEGPMHDLHFRHINGNAELVISVTPSETEIRVDDMNIAAEIIQDLCNYLQIEELSSVADFPKQMTEFRDLLVRVDDCNSIRLKLTGEMADDSNQIKNLIIRAEDARILSNMPNMRSYYSELFMLNNQLLGEYTKRSTNHQALLDALKEVNNMIQLAARLRNGQAKSSVIVACRKAIKANNIHALFYIVKTGQEEMH